MEEHPVMTDVDGRIWSTSSRHCSCIILECGTSAGPDECPVCGYVRRGRELCACGSHFIMVSY